MNTPASLDQDQAPAKDIADIERFFSEMTPAHLARLGEVYSADAWFKDPFNEVQGLDAVRGIFQHMYDSLNQPRFIVTTRVVQGRQCFVACARHRWALAHHAPPRLLGRGRRVVRKAAAAGRADALAQAARERTAPLIRWARVRCR